MKIRRSSQSGCIFLMKEDSSSGAVHVSSCFFLLFEDAAAPLGSSFVCRLAWVLMKSHSMSHKSSLKRCFLTDSCLMGSAHSHNSCTRTMGMANTRCAYHIEVDRGTTNPGGSPHKTDWDVASQSTDSWFHPLIAHICLVIYSTTKTGHAWDGAWRA